MEGPWEPQADTLNVPLKRKEKQQQWLGQKGARVVPHRTARAASATTGVVIGGMVVGSLLLHGLQAEGCC